jgi:hypothetical protein
LGKRKNIRSPMARTHRRASLQLAPWE